MTNASITGDQNIVLQQIEGSQIQIVIHDGLDPEVKEEKQKLKQEIEALTDRIEQSLSACSEEDTKQAPPDQPSAEVSKLIKSIKAGKCVVLIGPEIARGEADSVKNLHEEKFQDLCNENPDLVFDAEEGFFQPHNPAEIKDEMFAYYDDEFPDLNKIGHETLYYLSQLPLSLMVNFSPDQSLANIWTRYDKTKVFLYYEPGAEINDAVPKKDAPVLLNILGNVIENGGDFIYTHREFYEYISEARLPTNIKHTIKNANRLLFIGFDFEKWYTRLLLFLLDFHVDNQKKQHQYVHTKLPAPQIKAFLDDQFSMTSIEQDYLGFAKSLAWEAQNQGIALDLKSFLFKKQLFKLKDLAIAVTDAVQLGSLKEIQATLHSITSLLDQHE